MEGQQPPAEDELSHKSAHEPDDGALGIEQTENRELTVQLSIGAFRLSLQSEGGSVTSDFHFDSLASYLDDHTSGDAGADREAFGRYEGAVDVLESFVLSAAAAGINVRTDAFRSALQMTLDAIGNNV